MNARIASPIFATILIAMFVCTVAYASVLREVNHGRDSSEQIGLFERSRFIEAIELHKRDYPKSRKRLMLGLVTGVFPLGLAALVILQHFGVE
jgi:hypothetical protein